MTDSQTISLSQKQIMDLQEQVPFPIKSGALYSQPIQQQQPIQPVSQQQSTPQQSTQEESQNQGKLTYNHDRYFPIWLQNNNCSIIFTSYKNHAVYTLGTTPKGDIETGGITLMRPMGIGVETKQVQTQPPTTRPQTLWLSNLGHVFRYENKGEETFTSTNETKETYDAVFYPQVCYLSGDVDIHDIVPTSKGVYYCSALFNCVCKPSKTKSFERYWSPPWIETNDRRQPGEDRCHLNGLCERDGVPRYVTSACRGNYINSWRDKLKEGVVYDIQKNESVCDEVWSPHSPKYYRNKLWVLESGSGYFGYIDEETNQFQRKTFLPGFLRGMDMCGDYAVVATSYDRHDSSFDKIELGNTLKEMGQSSKCGLWVIDLNTFDIKHYIIFMSGVGEIYGVSCLRGIRRPLIRDINDPKLLTTYHV